jgi:hypothetical protein
MIPMHTLIFSLTFSRIEAAKRWFEMFDQNHIHDELPQRPRKKSDRIKMAVLDTGIDLLNPWIQQKIGRIQCWPNETACKDTDGHGTQVAYLLLRLAPHTQLRIAKVASSQLLKDADINDIAKVGITLMSPFRFPILEPT